MGWIKKTLAGVLVTAIVAGAGYKGFTVLKSSNQKEVMVTSVSNITSDYYMPSTTLEGYIATNVSQSINVDSDMIVDEIFVEVGQSVKEGDKLVSFDMTLVEMEYNIAKLKDQKLQQDLEKAKRRLNSLKNGGPIEDYSENGYESNTGYDYENDDTEVSSIRGNVGGMYLASAVQPLLLATFTDEFVDEIPDELPEETIEGEDEAYEDSGISFQDPTAGDITDGSEPAPVPEATATPTPTPKPERDPNTTFSDQEYIFDDSGITDGHPTFYNLLDYTTEPFMGSGTEEDPYIFLCSSATGAVKAKGSFFNRMAGYSEDGSRVEKAGGSWFILEFHQNDTIGDFTERELSSTGYYKIDGSMLTNPVNMELEMEFTVEEAMQYEKEEEGSDDDYDGGGGYDGGGDYSTMTRAEAIKQQEQIISSLEMDIKESALELGKYEKKLKRKEAYSKLDGVVAYIEGQSSSTSDAFMKINSKDGFFVKGTVSELMLDQMPEGTILQCSGYESGSFEAKVIDISEYPVNSNSYWGEGNPNVSYYSYSAVLTDPTVQVQDSDWLTVTLESQQSNRSPLVVSKAFVRSENGISYVYVDKNGILEKRNIVLGEIMDGGYTVMIKEGLSTEDLIAFPYGKTVKEGARTKEVSLDEMYGY